MKKRSCLEVIGIVFLICSVILSFSIRILNAPQLEQKYLLGTDSYRFLRQADIIVSKGHLPQRDPMRWQPVGRDLLTHLNLFSYVLAYSYRLIRLIHPRITLYQVALYSPVVCYSFALLLLYLIWRRIFDLPTALLAVNLSAVLPLLNLHRSSLGFADRDAFCLFVWLAMILLYLKASDHQRLKKSGYAIGSGVTMGIFALSWEGCGLASACIALWAGLRILRDRFDRGDMLVYSLWYLCFASIGLTLTHAYRNWLSPYVFLAIGIPTIVWFCVLALLVLQVKASWTKILTYQSRFPKGVVSCIFGVLVWGGLFILLASLQSANIREVSQIIWDNFMSPLGKSRLMRTVSELRQLSGVDWVKRYYVVVPAAVISSVILTYRFFSSERVNFYLALIGFELILCGTLLSLFMPGLKMADTIFGITVFLGCTAILISYLMKRKPKEERTQNQEETLFVLIWLLFALFSARGAERYGFFLDPLITLLCSFFVIQSLRHFTKNRISLVAEVYTIGILIASEVYAGFRLSLWPRFPSWIIFFPLLLGGIFGAFLIKTHTQQAVSLLRRLGYLIIVLTFAILVSSDTFHKGYLHTSTEAMRYLDPISPRLQDNFAELAYHTSEEAIIAAWWDYGSRINWFAKRGTVIDEDHYIPYWIHLMGHYVFAARSPGKAQTFLYTHQATHLMITTENILQLKGITYTGMSDILDQLASVSLLGPITSQEASFSTEKINFILHPDFLAVDVLELDGRRYPSGGWRIHGVSIIQDKANNNWRAVIHGEAEGNRFSRPPRRFQFGEIQKDDEDGVPGAVIVFTDRNGNVLQGFYLSEIAQHLLAVRLYLFMEDIPGFTLVCDTNSVLRCNRDGIRLWKIDYPEKIQTEDKYLARDFPQTESGVREFWQRGDIMGLHFSEIEE